MRRQQPALRWRRKRVTELIDDEQRQNSSALLSLESECSRPQTIQRTCTRTIRINIRFHLAAHHRAPAQPASTRPQPKRRRCALIMSRWSFMSNHSATKVRCMLELSALSRLELETAARAAIGVDDERSRYKCWLCSWMPSRELACKGCMEERAASWTRSARLAIGSPIASLDAAAS